MNKKRVNELIVPAKKALTETGIVKDGKVEKTFRGQISSFGAAVVMGSLPAAVAFFIEKGGASVERQKLIQAMYYCITGKLVESDKLEEILDYVCDNNTYETRESFTYASIALKLAMNFFDMGGDDD